MPVPDPLSRIFITGAGSGIGQALAEAYAGPDTQLGLMGRDAAKLELTAARARGAQAHCYPGDVTRLEDCRQAADRFLRDAGAPQILIASAGIGAGTLTSRPEDVAVFKEIMDSNWLGTIHVFSVFLPAMLQARSGRLVGIASMAGWRGLPGAGAYSASKAAVRIYLESLRLELAGSGLSVSTICPGYIDTPMTRGNAYPMPWLMPVDRAARRIRRAVDRGQSFLILPRPMAGVAYLLKHLPLFLYDRLFRGMPRKARRPSPAGDADAPACHSEP